MHAARLQGLPGGQGAGDPFIGVVLMNGHVTGTVGTLVTGVKTGLANGQPQRLASELVDAARIGRLREALGLTRERFAEALGVSTSTLQRWERGSSKPDPREREFLEALQELSDQIAKEGREKVARAIEVMAKAGATAGLGLTAVGLFIPLAPIFAAALGITSASLIKRILDAGDENPEPASRTKARSPAARPKP